jgi:hypothetical protein
MEAHALMLKFFTGLLTLKKVKTTSKNKKADATVRIFILRQLGHL